MKNILLICFVFLFYQNYKLHAQTNTNNYIYGELGGANTLYSINLEKKISVNLHWVKSKRIGFCYLGANNIGFNFMKIYTKNTTKKWKKVRGFGIAANRNLLLNSNISFQGIIGFKKYVNKSQNYIQIAINPSINLFHYNEINPISAQFLYPSIGFGRKLN